MTKLTYLLLILCTLFASRIEAQDANELAFFEKKIRPVLVQHCYKCHAADSKNVRGGLLLDTRAGIRKGGDSGPAVVPNKVDESLLIESLRYDGYEMPPSGKLADDVIADFEKWVQMGAPDPRDGESHAVSEGIDLEAGRQFWSFQPPKETPIPQVKNADWPRGEIDRFTLSAMEDAGLVPADDADKRTLLRRVYFDLIGLPPTPEQIHAFLSDESPQAFERVVDELLASPHFGERWGRHWLDIARYSDSTGGGRSLLFKVAWRYRNYVIDAFNRDTPFDRFIVEQIAGDLMPSANPEEQGRQLTATGFLTLGPTNYENQDKRQLRMDVVDEQIDTIGRAFLGMTIGCARCHDHKFDPIPTKDYYALAGIFRSTKSLIDGNVSNWITRPLPKEKNADLDEKLQATQLAFDESKKRLVSVRKRLPAFTLDNDDAVLVGNWKESTYTKGFVGKHYIHTNDRAATATFTFATNRKAGRYRVLASYTPGGNREKKTPYVIRQGDVVVAEVRMNQRAEPTSQFVLLGEYDFDPQQSVSVTVGANGTTDVVIADAVKLQHIGSLASDSLQKELARAEKEKTQRQQELGSLKKAATEKSLVLSVEEEKKPGDFHVCVRGNVRRLGDKVSRGVLSVASRGPVQIPPGTSGRLELAKWIASSENPLTARVAANRIWSHLFGTGIVRTVDNFGVPGERPTNPALLDFLALRFVEYDWSVKRLIREVVLSRTYQLSSSAGTESLLERDPENKLYARQNRRRLQAESLRDALFSLSAELDMQSADDTVRSGTKSGYGYQFTSSYRSVYLPVFRNRLHPMFAVFDFPDPNLSNGRRNVSTLSTQALYLMNSPLVQQHAEQAATRLLLDSNQSDADRLAWLYESALGRLPSREESQLAMRFLKASGGTQSQQWTALCHAVISSVDFRYVK